MVAMLSTAGLTKRYGGTAALSDISFDLERGKVLAVIGGNGAGKTTLIKCVLGLVRYEGQVLVDGLDIARKGPRAKRSIGYVPQSPALHPDLTVRETAIFYADMKRVAHDRARALVESVGLGEQAEKRVDALSGGMRQRLTLAIALLADPALLLLDEPGAGLDISARLELRHLVQQQRTLGKAILLATHWIEDVPYIADQVLVLDHGQTRSFGPASALAESAAGARLYLRLNGHSPEAVSLVGQVVPNAAVDRNDDWLVVTCTASQKAHVVEVLIGAGISILDLRVEEATAVSFLPQREREGIRL